MPEVTRERRLNGLLSRVPLAPLVISRVHAWCVPRVFEGTWGSNFRARAFLLSRFKSFAYSEFVMSSAAVPLHFAFRFGGLCASADWIEARVVSFVDVGRTDAPSNHYSTIETAGQ